MKREVHIRNKLPRNVRFIAKFSVMMGAGVSYPSLRLLPKNLVTIENVIKAIEFFGVKLTLNAPSFKFTTPADGKVRIAGGWYKPGKGGEIGVCSSHPNLQNLVHELGHHFAAELAPWNLRSSEFFSCALESAVCGDSKFTGDYAKAWGVSSREFEAALSLFCEIYDLFYEALLEVSKS